MPRIHQGRGEGLILDGEKVKGARYRVNAKGAIIITFKPRHNSYETLTNLSNAIKQVFSHKVVKTLPLCQKNHITYLWKII